MKGEFSFMASWPALPKEPISSYGSTRELSHHISVIQVRS